MYYNVATGVRFLKRGEGVLQLDDLLLSTEKQRILGALERLLIGSTKVAVVLEYAEVIAASRQFVVEHGLATLPPGEDLRVEPTPGFLRGVIPFAGSMVRLPSGAVGGLDALLAHRTRVVHLDTLQEGLFFERIFVQLGQRFGRAQNHIDQQPREAEDGDQQRRRDLQKNVSSARADVAERPPYAGDPQRYEVGGDDRDPDPQDAL